MPISTRTYAIIAAVAAAAGLGLTWGVTQFSAGSEDIFAQCRRGVVGGSGQLGGPFTLVSETGETVTDKDVVTGPSLLYFGYTYCPDVCPLDNTRNAEAVFLLDERGYNVTPVFISVDSERDTPETLAEFTDIMHPRMLGLTGSPEQIKAASQAYRTYYKVQNPGDPYTLIDHSTQTYLVFPEIGFVEFFNRDTTTEQMADQVACFVDAYNAAK
ncbi:SCO family protein [Pseudothioclava nitratireducens]|jgi:protein SCO1/2|uniref:SCO family protein n=1 Tax=Pseudothioclava nitratireducens TaxID=1928646 RepID=UPI0023DBA0C4|nr:SCO family protein [Defluviimonas nitratireducens]MDF1619887.1 SCO family protein [Defluviimonas nitratireducens]